MRNYAGFLTVGGFRRVAMAHVAFVDFKNDGSAVVHTAASNMTTSDAKEIADLHAFVGDDEPEEEIEKRAPVGEYEDRGFVPDPSNGPQLVPHYTEQYVPVPGSTGPTVTEGEASTA